MWSFDGRRIPKVFKPKADTLSLEMFKSGYRSRHRILFFRCSSDCSKTIRYKPRPSSKPPTRTLVSKFETLFSRLETRYSKVWEIVKRYCEWVPSGGNALDTKRVALGPLLIGCESGARFFSNPVNLNHINWETTLVGRRCILVEPETQWDRRCQH